eukprot:3525080-Pyramimonas_sp.AAC.1
MSNNIYERLQERPTYKAIIKILSRKSDKRLWLLILGFIRYPSCFLGVAKASLPARLNFEIRPSGASLRQGTPWSARVGSNVKETSYASYAS